LAYAAATLAAMHRFIFYLLGRLARYARENGNFVLVSWLIKRL
jgi:hypothetical protein